MKLFESPTVVDGDVNGLSRVFDNVEGDSTKLLSMVDLIGSGTTLGPYGFMGSSDEKV